MRLAPGGLAARCILMTSTALAVAGVGWAQEQPPAGDSDGSDRVVIVGSQIVGARPTDALPVTVIGEDELAAIGAGAEIGGTYGHSMLMSLMNRNAVQAIH